MSISPFQPDDRPLKNWQPAVSASEEGRTPLPPLTLSQALTITAGLAGLIGLISGVVIRFSIANSSNARFLSPLQTFPTLSDWAPELPQETADSHYLPAGTQRDTWEASSNSDTLSTLNDEAAFETLHQSDQDAFDGSNFDAFANRNQSENRSEDPDPWEVLSNGPKLSERQESDFLSEESDSIDTSPNADPTYFQENYEESYSADSYEDESYEEVPYDPYQDSPSEDSDYENYFNESEPFIDQSEGNFYSE